MLDRFNAGFGRLAHRYKRVIAWALDHRLAVVALSVGTFVFALVMPVLGLVGTSFVPIDDRSEFTVQLETPPGSNLEYTRRKAEEVGRLIRAHPEIRYTYTRLGASQTGAVDEGLIYVKMTRKDERHVSADKFALMMRGEIRSVAGVKLAVFTSDIGGGRKQLQLEVRGSELANLTAIADLVQAQIEKVPNAVDIALSTKGQKPEINVDVDRGLAGTLGVTVGQVAQSLRPAFAGIDAGDWLDPGGETRDVMVRLSPEARQRLTDLRDLPLVIPATATSPAATVPLGQVATITQGIGPAVIDHLNRDLVVIVGWNASGRSTGEVMADAMERVRQISLPEGVSITQGGDAAQQTEIFGNIFLALGVAALFMYLILAIQFGSFVDPLAIMMSLPLSLIGVMLALAVTGTSINIMSLIGVILLMGIVAKNAILLIDFAKWSRERDGKPLREALI
jgi:HAE1 family hydrophobic/amphiphilic exporter-1